MRALEDDAACAESAVGIGVEQLASALLPLLAGGGGAGAAPGGAGPGGARGAGSGGGGVRAALMAVLDGCVAGLGFYVEARGLLGFRV